MNHYIQPMFITNFNDRSDETNRILKRYTSKLSERQKITAKAVTDAICFYYQISFEDMVGKSHEPIFSKARQITAYILSRYISFNDEVIATIINRDRTTVIHAKKLMVQLIDIGDKYGKDCMKIINALNLSKA